MTERRKATADDLWDEIHGLRMDIGELLGFLREQAEQNQPALYCPPSEHCPGGIELLHHSKAYWKNDGNDGDRFYHPLPESDWYAYQGEGAFHGATVKAHNVWRSDALRERPIEGEEWTEPDEPAATQRPSGDNLGDSRPAPVHPATQPATALVAPAGDPPWLPVLVGCLGDYGITNANPVADYLASVLGKRPSLNAAVEEWLGDDQSAIHIFKLVEACAAFAGKERIQPTATGQRR